jgi:hypothetical protein
MGRREKLSGDLTPYDRNFGIKKRRYMHSSEFFMLPLGGLHETHAANRGICLPIPYFAT